jgi:hypothetical protein
MNTVDSNEGRSDFSFVETFYLVAGPPVGACILILAVCFWPLENTKYWMGPTFWDRLTWQLKLLHLMILFSYPIGGLQAYFNGKIIAAYQVTTGKARWIDNLRAVGVVGFLPTVLCVFHEFRTFLFSLVIHLGSSFFCLAVLKGIGRIR